MTPNLFLATQTLFSPHKWFKSQKVERPKRRTEHWNEPVPGVYEYIPGRGWYLVATDQLDPSTSASEDGDHDRAVPTMNPPVMVKYSKVLKRYLLCPDYEQRKRHGTISAPIPSNSKRRVDVAFFRLDDGIAWVQAWDEHGEFIPGPYKLWCFDTKTNQFRHMIKADDPNYVRSRASSIESSHRRSQDSRSTLYRSRPGSTRDGPSMPGSRSNSVRAFPAYHDSMPNSKPGSRRTSPGRGRSPTVPLAEASSKLRLVAQEQAAAQRARASSQA
ncbi:hypothetical protein P154DRAFT_436113 [Amniculicola lignicola CBS 123094]|uniref:Uncharacterized protein n=1 Tax=Amniculicola lignicola CBS 123094 TaxID=1392246 RepID=A0A6A5WG21_9PLEO|nr:hypothetical protein P154DRAFT_436113 [Amniculicola lignicola CBS 123094]